VSGGVLQGDTNWVKEGNPYRVVSTVQVPAGVTLTIELGVQIVESVDPLLVFRGTINAIRSEEVCDAAIRWVGTVDSWRAKSSRPRRLTSGWFPT
jgi:hypothetical protein